MKHGMIMIFIERMQLDCYAVPELPPSRNPLHNYIGMLSRNYPRPGIPYIKFCIIDLLLILSGLFGKIGRGSTISGWAKTKDTWVDT